MEFPQGFVHINRLNKGDLSFQTLGELMVFDWDWTQQFNCKTVEPQWNGNKTSKSCMPNGWYWLVKRWSQRYGHHFEILDVPYRSYMLIHVGNFRKDTEGCILPGVDFIDIDDDGHKDVTSSGDTMSRLNGLLPNKVPILITSQFKLTV